MVVKQILEIFEQNMQIIPCLRRTKSAVFNCLNYKKYLFNTNQVKIRNRNPYFEDKTSVFSSVEFHLIFL